MGIEHFSIAFFVQFEDPVIVCLFLGLSRGSLQCVSNIPGLGLGHSKSGYSFLHRYCTNVRLSSEAFKPSSSSYGLCSCFLLEIRLSRQ
jgi:hypothetical protein